MPKVFKEHYRDSHILVLEKPFGLASQPTRKGEDNLYDRLCKQEEYVGLHHRLDRPASGLMLFALSKKANPLLGRAFLERRIHRHYLMVLLGSPPSTGSWSFPIDGKEAVTHFKTKAHANSLSLVEARLETGRTHQIRRHCSMAGHPIVGDRRYGASAGRLWPRLALHAHRIRFKHPLSQEELEFTAPIPEDLQGIFSPLEDA
jgi:23S rRNA-/tRNA-specific pseudouridylate synthase